MSEIVPIDQRVWRRVERIIDTRYEDPKHQKRIQKIAQHYLAGKTCAAIAENVGVTAERVRQILRGLGIKRQQGGVSLRTRRRMQAQEAEKLRKFERLARRYYHCTNEEVEAVIRAWRALSAAHRKLPHWAHRSPLHRFRVFHASLKNRHRTVTLTLPEWWALWEESGHWTTYGRGRNKHHMEVRHPERPVDVRNLVVVASSDPTSSPSSRSAAPRRGATAKRGRGTSAKTQATEGRKRTRPTGRASAR